MPPVYPEHQLLLDWDDTGLGTLAEETQMVALLLGGPSEVQALQDVSGYALPDNVLRCRRGRTDALALSPPIAGDWSGRLNNVSRIFSAHNDDSPLAGMLGPGHWLRWQCYVDAVLFYIWTGLLRRVRQHPQFGVRQVSLSALDPLSRLAGKDGFSTEVFFGLRSDQCLGVLYDLVGDTDPAMRVFSQGKTIITVFWVAPGDDLGAKALAIYASEGPGAELYADRQGRKTFLNRHDQFLLARCAEVQATLRDAGTEPTFLGEGYDYDDDDKHVVNVCNVLHRTRTADAALSDVWRLGAVLTLGPNEVYPIDASSGGSDPIVEAVTPVLGTDYTVDTGGAVTPALGRDSGAVVPLTLTAGANGAVVRGPIGSESQGIKLRGKLLRVTNERRLTNSIDTSASQLRYDPKPFTLPTLPEVDADVLQDFCDATVLVHQTPPEIAVLPVNNGTPEQTAVILESEIADRVRAIEGQTGYDAEWHVRWIETELRGRTLTARLGVQKAPSLTFWVLGDDVLGVLGESAWAGW